LVQALLDISENTNRVLNVIKAKYNLKDKSQAVEYLVGQYVDESEDRELRPEFIERIKKARKGKFHTYKNMEDFAKAIGLKDVPKKSRG
jgi:hypothetical protein